MLMHYNLSLIALKFKIFVIKPLILIFLLYIFPDQYKFQEMFDKAVNTSSFVFGFVPDQYKTQKISDKVVSKISFMVKYCLDRCKTQ